MSFLDKKPTRVDVLLWLSRISASWRTIGTGLRVDFNDLDVLAKSAMSDKDKLDSVLEKWIRNDDETSPVIWRTIIDVVKGPLIQNRALANEIYQNLEKENSKKQPDTTSAVSSCSGSEKQFSNESPKKKENNIELILDKKPERKHVVDLLAKNAHEYEKFAIALNVDDGFVKGLSGDGIVKLNQIIGNWMTTRSSPVTWRTIIKAVESNTFGKNLDLADKIRDWLKEDENFSSYYED